MTGYTPEAWHDLFLCSGGAAAALSGMIFVGLSVNIRTVLELDQREGQNFMTGRALEALVALLSILVISVVGLTPALDRGLLAALLLLIATASAVSPIRAMYASRGRNTVPAAMFLRLLVATALTLALATAGTTLAAGHGGGLYWIPAAFVLAVTVAAVNAWILLVEVLR